MNALVTGATGFIGSFLADSLVRKGIDVTCVVRKGSDLRWIGGLPVRHVLFDLCDSEEVVSGLPAYDMVFHVAGVTKAASAAEFLRVNGECTRKLTRALARSGKVRNRFLFLSSLAAIGPGAEHAPVTEESPPRPVSAYGASKLEGERAVLDHDREMPITIIRPPAVYGPRDRDFHLLFRMIKRGFVPSWGTCHYSLLYVEDLVKGIILAAEAEAAAGKVFFLSDGEVYTNDDIAQAIAGVLNVRPVRLPVPRWVMPALAFFGQKIVKKGIMNSDRIKDLSHSYWVCDSSRARREIGFEPATKLREGIQWTADWYKTNRWL